ncbi:MAG: DinB family protein [Chitinophagales bacterium]
MDTLRWTQQVDQVTQEVKRHFGDLSEDQLNWKPAPAVWSIAENLHHLITVNNTYPPIIQQLRNGTYKVSFLGSWKWLVNAIGNMILGSVQPDRKRPMKTFPIWEPASGNIPEILKQFEAHQSALHEMIAGSADLLGKQVVIASPANNKIVYTLEKAFDIIVAHEYRHVQQALEIKTLIKNNIA